MMKTFKDIISEVAEPTARREKEFKDKHVVQKINHPVTDMDALTAKSAKKDKTKKASLHGDEDEAVYEEKMSDAEMKKREDIVMGMKKSKADLKKRYGDRWKSVMYATATKNAMKEEVELDEGAKEKALKALMTKALGGKRAKAGYTSAVAQNGDFVVKDGGSRIVGRIKAGSFTDPLKEEIELDEDITKMSHGRLKWHMNTGVPHGSYTKDEMKKERDRRLSRVDTHAAYKKAKAGLSEEVESLDELSKKTLGSYIKKASQDMANNASNYHKKAELDGYKYQKYDRKKDARRTKGINTATDKLTKESVDLDEAFKAGSMKLADGSSVKVTTEQANILNSLFSELNSSNKKKMEERLMSSSKGFNEILSFAKEAL